MLRLDLPTESRWLDLGQGVRVLSKPLTTALSIAAESYALRERDRLRAAAEAAGLPDPFGRADLSIGLSYQIRMESLAAVMIDEWEGVGTPVAGADGKPTKKIKAAPLTPEAAAALMRHDRIAASFDRQISHPLAALDAEGNGSARSPNTTSAQGANTATGAASRSGKSAKPARIGRKRRTRPTALPPGSPGDPA